MDDESVFISHAGVDAALDHLAGEFALVLDAAGTILGSRGAVVAVVGTAPTPGDRLTDFVHPDDHTRLLEAFAVRNESPSFDVVVRWRHADGSWRSIECSTAPVGDGTFVFVAHDVTSRLVIEAEAQAYDALFAVWHDGVPIGVAHDAVARLAEAAVPSARAAVYVRRGDDYELAAAPRLGGRWTRVGFRLSADDFATTVPGAVETAPAAMVELATDHGLGFAWVVAAPGTEEPPTGLVVVFVGEKRFLNCGERAGLDRAAHVLARTLTSERRLVAQHGATGTDAVTGVAARPAVVAALAAAGSGATVMAVQVDGLAEINRERGTDIGDAVLVQVARSLCQTSRQRDLVGRIGSRTFVVVGNAAERDDRAGVGAWSERVLAALRSPVLAGGERIEPRCRIAVAAPLGAQDGLDALDEALGLLERQNLRSGRAVGDR